MNKIFDVNSKDERGLTLLHFVAERGNIFFVKLLIEHEIDINAITTNNWTALEAAIFYRHSETAKILIDNGANIHNRSLIFATKNGIDKEIIEILINMGADINVKDQIQNGDTPLHYAASNDRFEIVKMLVEKGADINAKNCRGMTPIMNTIRGGYIQIENFLIENGADLTIKDSENNTYAYYKEFYKKLKEKENANRTTI